jgi:hypothetical protein
VTDAVQLALRLGLLAALITLLVAIPNRASGSRIYNGIGVFFLAGGFLGCCALLAEMLADITLYAVPVSAVVIVVLLFLVIEPKVSTRLRAIFPNRRMVQASLAWVVRGLGGYGALVVYFFILFQLPVAIFAAVTLASGLLFLSGLLTTIRQSAPPADRRGRLRRWGGFTLVVLGMMMIFGGSFGVLLLFDFPYVTGTSAAIMYILFGPVYSLGWPVCFLGLWLLGVLRKR